MKSNVPRQCLFTFEVVLLCADWVNLTAQMRESYRGIGGGIQISEMYLQALHPFRQSALEHLLVGYLLI